MIFVCLISGMGLAAERGAAQEAVVIQPSISAEGQDYRDNLQFGGIETEVIYHDPGKPAPELTTDQAPPKPAPKPGEQAVSDLGTLGQLTVILAIALLLGLLVLAVRLGGNVTLSTQGQAQNMGRNVARAKAGRLMGGETLPELEAILALVDKRLALLQLARLTLVRTVTGQGVLLQDSWTARDALRHIPRDVPHLDALRRLVLMGEKVQFGDRDVTDAEFVSHYNAVAPLLGRTVA